MGVDDQRSPVLGGNESDDSTGTRERIIGAMVRYENVGCHQPQMKFSAVGARVDDMVRVYSHSGAHSLTHPS